MSPKRILISAGEPSGDLHASNLVKDLKRLKPDLEFFGIGGEFSRRAGVAIPFDISRLAVVGLTEVLKNLSTISRIYKGLLDEIDSKKPDIAILVDYPGFNFRLAKALKKRSIPVVYYISPQIWAWGKGRIKIIKECVEKVIVFFKFEEELYKREGVDVECVGHPLLDIAKPGLSREEFLNKHGLSGDRKTVALLPGSRAMEVKALLPVMARTSEMLERKAGRLQFLVAKYGALEKNIYNSIIEDRSLDMTVVENETYDMLAASDFAIVASGTAALETAIIGTPFVITYKTSLLNYLICRPFVKTPFLGLVNVISGKEVVPELIQFNATPQKISDKVFEILSSPDRMSAMRETLKGITSSLGASGASLRAAKAILGDASQGTTRQI
jgi:lipid-A-disaccharide synthase